MDSRLSIKAACLLDIVLMKNTSIQIKGKSIILILLFLIVVVLLYEYWNAAVVVTFTSMRPLYHAFSRQLTFLPASTTQVMSQQVPSPNPNLPVSVSPSVKVISQVIDSVIDPEHDISDLNTPTSPKAGVAKITSQGLDQTIS